MRNSRDCSAPATGFYAAIKARDDHLRTLVSVSDAYRRSVMHEMGLVVIDHIVARMDYDGIWSENRRLACPSFEAIQQENCLTL